MAALKRKTEGKSKSKARKRADSGGRGGPLAKESGGSVGGSLEGRAARQVAGGDRAGVLIRLEGSIDDMLHEIKRTGGHPEIEETLRRARRILVRSHGE